MPKFSIIVPAREEETVIGRCLDTLLKLDYPKEKMEIIVVEGGSRDATPKICSEFSRHYPAIIRVISEGTSNGKPRALNFALPHITGEIVGVFDADSVPENDVLRKVAWYFKDQSLKAIQGSFASLNERKNMLTRIAAREEKAWYQTLLRGREKLGLFIPLNGSCQFVRRDVLEELNGWDESSLAEDVELALRLVERKYLVKYASDICSWQETPSRFADLFSQRVRWYRGYMELAFKYGRLIGERSKKAVDAEISLFGPFMMVLCLMSWVNWVATMLFFPEAGSPTGFAAITVILTVATLLSIGSALLFLNKPVRLRNVLWVPFVFLFWLVEMGIASWAFLQILFRRRKVWKRTEKRGTATMSFSRETI